MLPRSGSGIALLAAIGVAGATSCGAAPWSGKAVDGRIPFRIEPLGRPLFRGTCQPRGELPDLPPLFLPTVSGQLSLIAARGDARASVPDYSLWVAAPDRSFVAVAEPGGAVTVWRSGDGVLLQRVMCPRPAPVAELIAISADLRWVVVSGGRPEVQLGDMATCIVDLQAGAARVVPGELRGASFDLATRTVLSNDRGFHLDTGEPVHCFDNGSRAPDARFLRDHRIAEWDNASQVATSHDGRYLAAWDTSNLGVWDLTTGKRLWTRNYWGGVCRDWRFTPDDAQLEPTPGHAPAFEQLATVTGLATPLPGDAVEVRPPIRVTDVLPRGDPIALGNSYLLAPQAELRRALAYPEPLAWRTVVARSADGTARAELELGAGLLVETGERCFTLGTNLLPDNPVGFSPDGALLYAVRAHPYRAWDSLLTMLGVWRTDTGALVQGLELPDEYAAVLIPGAGRVAFGPASNDYQVGSRLHIVDALGGREVAALDPGPGSPWVPDARGTTWLLPAGEPRGRMYRWELGDPRAPRPFLAELPEQITIATFSPDGRRIAAAMTGGAIAVWSRDTERVTATVAGTGRVERLAFSPDGRWLASADGGDVRVTDVATGALLGAVALTTDRARLLWWSPGSDRLVIDTQRRFEITVAPPAGP